MSAFKLLKRRKVYHECKWCVYCSNLCITANTVSDVINYTYESRFVKFTPVMLMGSTYIDLETGEIYDYGVHLYTSKGRLYIDCIFPYTSFISIKKQSMSKRRILKKYNKYKIEVYNECKNRIKKDEE